MEKPRDDLPPEGDLPPAVRRYAPWRWKRTTHAKILGVLLFVVSLSPGVVTYLGDYTDWGQRNKQLVNGLRQSVRPVAQLGDMWPFLKAVNREETLLLRDTFGDTAQ